MILRQSKILRIFIGKTMNNDYWIVSVFGIDYGFRIVDAFRIVIGKGMVNDYWIIFVFGIVIVFVM